MLFSEKEKYANKSQKDTKEISMQIVKWNETRCKETNTFPVSLIIQHSKKSYTMKKDQSFPGSSREEG